METKSNREPHFLSIFNRHEDSSLGYNGTFSDLSIYSKPSDDFASYNMGRRVSIKSTGSHKFTVINYGKNANLNAQTSSEDQKEKTCSGKEDPADCKNYTENLIKVTESGIWMGKNACDFEGFQNEPPEYTYLPGCYQCKNPVIEEAAEEVSPSNSYKTPIFTTSSCEKNLDSDCSRSKDDYNNCGSPNAFPEERLSNSRNSADVVLQIEEFSDDNLDQEIPSDSQKLVEKNAELLNLKNRRRIKTDICLSNKDLDNDENFIKSPYLTPLNPETPTYVNYANGKLLQQDDEEKCLNSTEQLDTNKNQLNNVKIESLNNETSSILTGNMGTNESSLLLQDSKKNSLDKNSSIGSSISVEKSAKNPKSQVCHWRDMKLAKLGRIYCKRNKLRLVQQNGDCNVVYSKVDRRGVRYLNDLYTTLMEIKWRYIISVYLLSFLLSWNIFALLWWSLHLLYGTSQDGRTCVEGVLDFRTALLFSIETQSTIGYGSRSVTDLCPPAFGLLMIQTVFGAVSQCIATGLIFSKLSRPSRRAETIIFSKNAVICSRDECNTSESPKEIELDEDLKDQDSSSSDFDEGNLNLEFRVGDIRNSQLIGVRISAILVKKNFIENGRQVELKQERLIISTESDDDFYFLAWPIKVIHRIDQKSPFWGTTNHHLALAEFEILIVLEANCESTGGTMQVKTSYLPSEIVWGARLAPLFTRPKYNGRYTVDYSRFHQILPDPKMISEEEIENVSNGFDSKPSKRKFRFSFREEKDENNKSPMRILSKFSFRGKTKKKVSYSGGDEVETNENLYVQNITDKKIFEQRDNETDNKIETPEIKKYQPFNRLADIIEKDDYVDLTPTKNQPPIKPKVTFKHSHPTTPCLLPLHSQHETHLHPRMRYQHQNNMQVIDMCSSHQHCRSHQQHHHHHIKRFSHKPSYISLQSYDSLPSVAYEDLNERTRNNHNSKQYNFDVNLNKNNKYHLQNIV